MNLATRCASCGTVFRVGQDQLQASEGWVRCGRCDGVFNASEVLFDIDTGAPMQLAMAADPVAFTLPPAPAAGLPSADAAEAAAPTPSDAGPTGDPADGPAPAWAADAPGARREPAFDPAAPGSRTDPDEPLLRAPSLEPDTAADGPIVITDYRPARRPEPADPALLEAGLGPAAAAWPAAPVATPSFLRRAERDARWRQPLVRSGLWTGVGLLAIAAMVQMALLWRDPLAAHLPVTAPALQALCRVAGCAVQPLRRIEQLSVDSSGLNRLDGSPYYQLQLVLRNRADTAVMLPALDLSLNDAQGRLLSRRALRLDELGVTQAALQAGRELPIKVLLSTGDRRVEGYTLEIFYP